MLDPQARALMQLMADRQVPPTHTLTPAQARQAYLDRRFYSQPEPPAVAEVRALRSAGGVPLRLYRPAGAAAAVVLPVLVFFHGGGWTMGDLDTHDVLCRQLSNGAGVAVVAVDYRMGPEHRFPAAVDDSIEATRWVRAQAAALGVDGARMAVGGDSAGGNLAAVVALAMRDADAVGAAGAAGAERQAPLAFQLLIYPATDMRAVAPSHQRNAQGYVLTVDTMNYFRDHYMGTGPQAQALYSDWRASPLLAASHAGLPPALVLTAGYDPLVDEGRQYADALSAAGTPCQYVCFERQIHGFLPMSRILDEARTALALCCAVLREALLKAA